MSRPSWHHFLIVPLLLAVAACTKPTTFSPTVSIEEIDREAAIQAKYAEENPFDKIDGEVKVTSQMLARMERMESRIVPHASALCRELFKDPDYPCEFSIEVNAEAKGINAFADGRRVVMGPTMFEFAGNDTHVAFVLAHELAHNIMKHPQGGAQNATIGAILGTVLDAAVGGTGGAFGQLGARAAQLQYSPSFETEADYIGLYILARAGYRIEEAPNFWRAMSQYDPQGIYARSTHPTNAERFVVMRKTINEIRSKQRLKFPLVPEFLPVENET